MSNYSEADLLKMKKADLVSICLENGLDADISLGKQSLIDLILSIGDETAAKEAEAKAEQEKRIAEEEARLKQINYERELFKRLGSKSHSNYELELARRRGAGAHITGEDAVAIELERRRKAFGKK